MTKERGIENTFDLRRMLAMTGRALAVVAFGLVPVNSTEAATEPVAPGTEAAEGRCDLGFNTDVFNEANASQHQHHGDHEQMDAADITVEDWAEVFAGDMPVEQVVREVDADELYRRQIEGKVLTHTLGPDQWTPMTNPTECEALADELDLAAEAAANYPTVADAEAAGYKLGDRYYGGLGAHYQDGGLVVEEFRPKQPAELLYAGTENDDPLVGLSYVVRSDKPPEGFTGPNDHWHEHDSFCLDMTYPNMPINLAADVLTPEECIALGAASVPGAGAWMLHVWPENDWGVFAVANPEVKYASPGE